MLCVIDRSQARPAGAARPLCFRAGCLAVLSSSASMSFRQHFYNVQYAQMKLNQVHNELQLQLSRCRWLYTSHTSLVHKSRSSLRNPLMQPTQLRVPKEDVVGLCMAPAHKMATDIAEFGGRYAPSHNRPPLCRRRPSDRHESCLRCQAVPCAGQAPARPVTWPQPRLHVERPRPPCMLVAAAAAQRAARESRLQPPPAAKGCGCMAQITGQRPAC